jgi:hypothetical protein
VGKAVYEEFEVDWPMISGPAANGEYPVELVPVRVRARVEEGGGVLVRDVRRRSDEVPIFMGERASAERLSLYEEIRRAALYSKASKS